MTWDKWVSLVCDVVTVGAVLGAFWIARKALRTWRDQMVGSSRFELARSILYNSRLLARGIQSYRSVSSQQDRTPEGVLRSINESAAELDRSFIEAGFLFPTEMLDDECKELKACVDDLYLAAARYGRELKKPEDKQDQKRLQECVAIMWSIEDSDPFTERVERVVESLAEKLQSYVERH